MQRLGNLSLCHDWCRVDGSGLVVDGEHGFPSFHCVLFHLHGSRRLEARQNRKGSVGNIDQALVGLGIIGTLGLLFISADIAFGDEKASFAIVPLVFSFICGHYLFPTPFIWHIGELKERILSRHLHGCGNHFNCDCLFAHGHWCGIVVPSAYGHRQRTGIAWAGFEVGL